MYSHPSTHEPALSRSTALLRMAVRSLMAQEKNMSASQPHSFLLRSYITFCMPFSVFYQFTSRFSFLHPHRLYTKIFARKYYISENQIRHFSDFKIFLFSLYSNGLFCRIIELIVILCGLLCCVHFTQRAST